MINKKFFSSLLSRHQAHEKERGLIISASNNILHDAKKVIFALHREDSKTAEEDLHSIESRLRDLDKKYGHMRLSQEGAYMASVEEYVESRLFFDYYKTQKIDKIADLELDEVSYLGGICDLTGELVRMAVNKAAAGQYKEVGKLKEAVNLIMAELVQFDLRGYLRTKYDQAKNSLRKIEEINYEVNLRRK